MAAQRWSTAHLDAETTSGQFAAGVAQRSRPNPDRPRVRDPALQARIDADDAKQAQRLAQLEDSTFKRRQLARKLEAEGVPVVVVEDNDSLVQCIQERGRADKKP